MNYMKQVAQMLGVELNEEFNLTIVRKIDVNHKYKFTDDELMFFNEKFGKWFSSNCLCDILNGTCKIVKIPKPILDEAEKRYLSNIIKPFRNRVKFISKNRFDGFERIFITYFSKLGNKDYILDLPAFEEGTMYKGMELCKHYTLEELNI